MRIDRLSVCVHHGGQPYDVFGIDLLGFDESDSLGDANFVGIGRKSSSCHGIHTDFLEIVRQHLGFDEFGGSHFDGGCIFLCSLECARIALVHAGVVCNRHALDFRMLRKHRKSGCRQVSHLHGRFPNRPGQALRHAAGNAQAGKSAGAGAEGNGIHVGHDKTTAVHHLVGKRDEAFRMAILLFEKVEFDFAVDIKSGARKIAARFQGKNFCHDDLLASKAPGISDAAAGCSASKAKI